jgi:hypothetical protein
LANFYGAIIDGYFGWPFRFPTLDLVEPLGIQSECSGRKYSGREYFGLFGSEPMKFFGLVTHLRPRLEAAITNPDPSGHLKV